MTCIKCEAQYIGETGNELKTRMTVHRQQIKHADVRHLKVSKHMFECNRGFTVFPFYKLHSNASPIDRRAKEQYFINIFKPTLNA